MFNYDPTLAVTHASRSHAMVCESKKSGSRVADHRKYALGLSDVLGLVELASP